MSLTISEHSTEAPVLTPDDIHNFAGAMAGAGIEPPAGIEADGEIHRFSVNGTRGKSGWYVLHPGGVGLFGDWRQDVRVDWTRGRDAKLTDAERQALERHRREVLAKVRRKQDQVHAACRKQARKLWDTAPDATGEHPYLVKKGAGACGLKVSDGEAGGELLVPVRDAKGKLHGLQRILPDGGKFFLSGTAVQGHFHTIEGAPDTLYIVEGYATGAAVHLATGARVLVAFNCGNLEAVARVAHAMGRHEHLVVAGDNDQWTPGNPGVSKAQAAAKAVDAVAVVPDFDGLDVSGKPTDFDDLAALAGIEAVKRRLEAVMPASRKKDKPKLPAGFFAKDDGIHYQAPDGDEPVWICSPIQVVANTRDENGENHGRLLVFQDPDGREHRWSMPMSMLAGDGIECRKVLMDHGLLIAPGKPRERLSAYIQRCETKARALCVSRVGWHPVIGAGGECRHLFVLPDATLGPENGEKVLLQASTLDYNRGGYTARGDVAQWIEHVGARCRGNSRLLFAASCAFAAPLLDATGEENGGFNLVGDSSSGKTVALQVACSVSGGPDRLQRWRATANGLEGVAALNHDQLLCLDELGQVEPREAGETSYMLSNGRGKQRATRDGYARQVATWRLLFLSSGEIGLADHMLSVGKRSRAGQEIRLADIPADAGAGMGLFEDIHDARDPALFCDRLRESALCFHGAVGRAYLEMLAQPGMREDLSVKMRRYRDQFLRGSDDAPAVVPEGADGQVLRLAGRFALVAFAGELATLHGLTGWQEGEAWDAAVRCFRDWLGERGGTGAQEDREILSQVRLFFERYGESRFQAWTPPTGGGKDRVAPDRAGFVRYTDEGAEHYVLSTVFTSEVCRGFSSRRVADLLGHRGVLVPDKDGKNSMSPRIPAIGSTARCYLIRSDLLLDTF